MSQLLLDVEIKNRDKVFYDGQAVSVSSINAKGVFDILPQHANFISLVRDFIEVRMADGKSERFRIDKGVLKVEKNLVEFYLTS